MPSAHLESRRNTKKYVCAFVLLFSYACWAQGIQGVVLNGTTGKPEPRCQVKLFTGAGEQGHTATDEEGAFEIIPFENAHSRSLGILQVTHGGVDYFQPVRPQKVNNVTVYDSASRVNGISGHLSVFQFEVKGKVLQVTELHAFDNASSPPLTKASQDNVVFSIPREARLKTVTISAPDGGTLKVSPLPVPGQSGSYRIEFPMKPGMTKYAISYEIPYSGEFVFHRQAQYPLKRIGVYMPLSMHFQSLSAKAFHPIADQPGTQEQILEGVDAKEAIAFKLSGSGGLARSFRPLTPGEVLPKPEQHSPQWLESRPPEAITSGGRAHTASRRQVILTICFLVLAGMLLWRLLWKKNFSIWSA